MPTAPDPELESLYAELWKATDPGKALQIQDAAHARYLELLEANPLSGSSTNNLLPYPSPTDPISQGADAIRALADSIQGQMLAASSRASAATALGAAYADVPSLIFAAITCPAGTIWIDWECIVQPTSTAARQIDFAVAVDGALVADSARSTTLAASAFGPLSGRAKAVVTAGAHRIAVQGRCAAAAGQATAQQGSVFVLTSNVPSA